MRFTVAVLAFAGAAIAGEIESTVYSTDYTTITSCAETVTDCPAHSTVVSSSVVALTTSTVFSTTTRTVTNCAETVTNCPAHSTEVVTEVVAVSTTVCPVEQAASTEAPVILTNSSVKPSSTPSVIPYYPSSLTTVAPACPTYSVKTISTSYTTVIPTVVYETIAVPCPTITATPPPAANTTVSPPPVVTAGAAGVSGSLFFAAAAGLVAVALL